MGNNPVFTLPGPWRIPIQFDVSIIYLLLLIAALSGGIGLTFSLIIGGSILVSILLHELGHAFACRVQRVPVIRVVIHGGGGFCEHDPTVSPQQTEFIAIAGPLVNLALWAGVTLTLPLFLTEFILPIEINGTTTAPMISGGQTYQALEIFAKINLFLALFNLIPVLPLDGGRLLHSWLHRFFAAPTAAKITGGVGFILSILWIPLMFVVFFTLGFVLLFFPNILMNWRMMRGQ